VPSQHCQGLFEQLLGYRCQRRRCCLFDRRRGRPYAGLRRRLCVRSASYGSGASCPSYQTRHVIKAQVLVHLPNARGVLVTAGARGSAYAFRPTGGKPPLTARVPVLKVRALLQSKLWPTHSAHP